MDFDIRMHYTTSGAIQRQSHDNKALNSERNEQQSI